MWLSDEDAFAVVAVDESLLGDQSDCFSRGVPGNGMCPCEISLRGELLAWSVLPRENGLPKLCGEDLAGGLLGVGGAHRAAVRQAVQR